MAFSLGLTFVVANLSKKKIFIFNLIFSFASPIGLAIGIAISDVHNIFGDVANGVLQVFLKCYHFNCSKLRILFF